MNNNRNTLHNQHADKMSACGSARPSHREGDLHADAVSGSVRLDYKDDNCRLQSTELLRDTCKCRTCKTCGPKLGYITREIILDKSELFKKPYLLTLTVDPKNFNSPQDAHDYVKEKGFIRTLLTQYLNIKNWIWVLEFQKSGNPHWHILIDVSHLKGNKPINLERVWRLWCYKWKIGGVDLSKGKTVKTSEHAIRYITKYLVKYPKEGFPAWFLKMKNVRMIQSSSNVGNITPARDSTTKVTNTKKMIRESRALVDRMSHCDTTTKVINRYINLATGEEKAIYLGEIEASRGDIVNSANGCKIPSEVTVVKKNEMRIGYQYMRYFLEGVKGNIYITLSKIKGYLTTSGYHNSREVNIATKKAKLLKI